MPTETIAIPDKNLELLEKCLQGDSIARQELAEQISKIVYRHTNKAAFSLNLRLSREDYDDINQEVLIKLFENDNCKLRSFRRASRLERWIYVIVYRHMVDHRLRDAEEQKQRKTVSIHTTKGSDPDSPTIEDTQRSQNSDPREIIEYGELLKSLRNACKDVLSKEDQTILTLWCSHQYTTAEIGGLLGRKPNTISTLIYRAQAKILEYLREKEPDTVL